MTQPSDPISPKRTFDTTLKTGSITLQVGVPNFLMQLLSGELIIRLLTLKMCDDYTKLQRSEQCKILVKVALVGILTLGIASAATLMNPLFVWAIPLCILTTMGLGFTFMTLPAHQARQAPMAMVTEGNKLGRA